MTDDSGPVNSGPVNSGPVDPATMTTAVIATDARIPAEERGHLVILPKTIERIAQAAAGEVSGIVRESPRSRSRSATSNVHATARLYGQFARLHLDVAARYPEPIPDVVAEVRRRVTDRLRELAEITVTSCDVDVTSLHPPSAERRIR